MVRQAKREGCTVGEASTVGWARESRLSTGWTPYQGLAHSELCRKATAPPDSPA